MEPFNAIRVWFMLSAVVVAIQIWAMAVTVPPCSFERHSTSSTSTVIVLIVCAEFVPHVAT